MSVTLICGDAGQWRGSGDLVLTNPYGPIPRCLHGRPMVISLFEGKGSRQTIAEEWCGATLDRIGKWGKGGKNTIYVANVMPRKVPTDDLIEEEFAWGRGWMPVELPLRLLREYADDGITVWDGYCGRGTVGKACQMLNMNYIGIDINSGRIALARAYLEC